MDEELSQKDQDLLEAIEASRNDRYPRIIIVCTIISLSLLMIIAFVAMYDFMNRQVSEPIQPKNPAFFEEHLETVPSGK